MHTSQKRKIRTSNEFDGNRMESNDRANTRKPPALRSLCLGLCLALGAISVQAQPIPEKASAPLDPGLASASAQVQSVARWVADSRDNSNLPYLLIDKVNAQVFAFDRSGKLEGSAPALLGMAKGDRLLVSNAMAVDDIPPDSRITPAGRFLSRLAIDNHGAELLVIDYDAAISLHPVVKGTPEERRAERLGSATSEDNRISHGCINVPKDFYATVVSPTFARTRGVVYILPEVDSAASVFGMKAPDTELAGATGASAGAGQSIQVAAPK